MSFSSQQLHTHTSLDKLAGHPSTVVMQTKHTPVLSLESDQAPGVWAIRSVSRGLNTGVVYSACLSGWSCLADTAIVRDQFSAADSAKKTTKCDK